MQTTQQRASRDGSLQANRRHREEREPWREFAIRTFEELIEQGRQNVRFRNGATSELDVAQARELLENTRASIPQFEMASLNRKTRFPPYPVSP